jgi:hypothetical protein
MTDKKDPKDKRYDIEDDEEEYNESADEDFNPEEEDADVTSESEDEVDLISKPKPAARRKRKAAQLGELDSGDEATIEERNKAKKRRRKGETEAQDDVVVFSDDEGAEGGLIKTRRQRQQEKIERRPLANTRGATINIDDVWARLQSAPVSRDLEAEVRAKEQEEAAEREKEKAAKEADDEYITIKRTYRFAGEVQTEERRVLRSSNEARLYLEEQEKKSKKTADGKDNEESEEQPATPVPEVKLIRRPLKRPSRFEPNPLGEVKGLPPEHQLRWPRTAAAIPPLTATDGNSVPHTATSAAARLTASLKPKTLNTVDKSRYDWVQYIDKEGISEELDEYGKSKETYLGRKQFLNRVESRQYEEGRAVRLAEAKSKAL